MRRPRGRSSVHRPSTRVRSAALGALATSIALASCVDLPIIQANACGNRVVEPEIDEDCDGQPGCGEPGTAHACRYMCDADHGGKCPGAYGCGVDSVCRTPSGKLDRLSTLSTVTTMDLLVGDTNADGCQEVVHTTLDGTTVTSFDSHVPGLCSAIDQAMPAAPPMPGQRPYPSPLLSELTSNARPELLLAINDTPSGGLFVYSSDQSPSLEPILYPSQKLMAPGVRVLTVNIHGTDELLLFLGDGPKADDMGDGGMPMMNTCAPDMMDGGMPMPDGGMPPPDGGPPPPNPPKPGSVQVALLKDASSRLEMAPTDELPFSINDIAAVQAADIDGDGCDEVVLGLMGDTQMHVYSLCSQEGHMVEIPGAAVNLDAGAKLRAHNASIAVADLNGDMRADIVANADDCSIHIAYGDGKAHFGALPPPGMADQKTGPLALDPMLRDRILNSNSIFVAGHFEPNKLNAQIAGLDCPPAMPFQSEVCSPVSGECEAVVVDIDRDGLDDIVVTKGQQPGLIVSRAGQDGGFHISSLDTQCPAHGLAAADFDDDGVNDIAFFDQVASFLDSSTPRPSTVLRVAHGNAFATPSEPEGYSRFEQAIGLTSGHFSSGRPGAPPAPSLYGVRGFAGDDGKVTESGLALVEGHRGRRMLTPLYFRDSSHNGFLSLEPLATARGRFTLDAMGNPQSGVAVMTLDSNAQSANATQLWLIEDDATTGSAVSTTASSLPMLACDSCVLAAADVDASGADELVALGDKSLVVYSAGQNGFGERNRSTLMHSFKSYDPASNPARHLARPLVADLDGDGHVDIVAPSTDGALIALWGKGDGGFTELELAGPIDPKTNKRACQGKALALVNLDADPAREVVVIGPGELSVCSLDTKARQLVPKSGISLVVNAPAATTDYTAVAAGDLDGDGVDDLVLMTSGSSIDILRGVPVHE